ncbi:unnamed protein product [Meganyctiphanes norvegica]|uniref:Neuropeptide CCHamide-1 n=1 Tax=Meganyctiphanes norvegica TaxID=48144 RepID=A0AAV2QEC6_MEGNR
MLNSSCMRGFVVLIAVMALVRQAQGSCYQFGHSCFGAHGKRSGGDRGATGAAGPLAVALAPPLTQQQPDGADLLPYDVPNIAPQDLPSVNNWLGDLVLRLRQRTYQQQQLLQKQQMMLQQQQQQLLEQQQQQLPEHLLY